MKLFYENKEPESKPFPFFHTRVAFKIPADYKKRDLRVLIYNAKKKLIYSATVPKKETPNLEGKVLDPNGKFF